MNRHEAQVEVGKLVNSPVLYDGGGKCEISWGFDQPFKVEGRSWDEVINSCRKLIRDNPDARKAALE